MFKNKSQEIIKIADFGESKYLERSLTTYCGTPDYMAPEIIRGMKICTIPEANKPVGMSYGLEVDMWAVGVIAFVMMGGYVPFDGDNDSEVFASILGLKFYFQSPEWDHVGQDGRDFIRSLLKLNPGERLTARQALTHPFITKFAPENFRTVPPLPSETSPVQASPPSDDIKNSSNTRGRGDSNLKSNSGKIKAPSTVASDKLDLTKNPRQAVLDRISNLSKSIGKDDAKSGELKYMKSIVSATGTCTSKLEVAILEETWERLNVVTQSSSAPKSATSAPSAQRKGLSRNLDVA